MTLDEYQETIANLAGVRDGVTRPPRMREQVDSLIQNRLEVPDSAFDYDEAQFLRAVSDEIDATNEIDATKDADAAWRIVADVSVATSIQAPNWFGPLYEATVPSIGRHCVAYFTRRNGEVYLNSGVLVGIHDRVFVMTAAHTLPPHSNGRLHFLSSEMRTFDALTPHVLTHGKRHPERPDVGFVELEQDFVQAELRAVPLPLARLAPVGAGDSSRFCYLIGFPSVSRDELTPKPNVTVNRFPLMAYFNHVVPVDYWNSVESSRDPEHYPNPDLDVFLPYPTDEEMICSELSRGANLPDPHGMSGCALWQNFGESKLWSPDEYKVIAIQSRWPKFGRHLQATQVYHWLQLVGDANSDLRSVLSDAFPETSFRW